MASGSWCWPGRTDVADRDAVFALVAEVTDRFGRVDLFCSNAGVTAGAGVDADPAVWLRTFDINVLAHVHAAAAVVPGMLDRGSGYLLNTASAAGLLTSPGDVVYAVTKHAAVGFAEWLSVTYGDRGIGVSVLCPLGVATPLLMDPLAENHPSAQTVAASGEIISTEQVADAVVDGARAGEVPDTSAPQRWPRTGCRRPTPTAGWLAYTPRSVAGESEG